MIEQVLGLEGDCRRGMDGCLSIDEKRAWIDKNGEGGIVEVEVHRERKVERTVRLCVMGVVKEHVERVGWIQHEVGCRVVGAI